MNAQFRSQPFATPPLPQFLPATRLLHHPTLHLAMSDMTLPDLLLAVNPSIWTFHTWKTRTGNMLPPFDEFVTFGLMDPDSEAVNQHVSSWTLTYHVSWFVSRVLLMDCGMLLRYALLTSWLTDTAMCR